MDQARADSVEETNTRLALDKSRQCGDITNTRLSTELELTVWKSHLANTRLAVYHASF